MLESVLQNLINIGWAMLIFLAAYLANVAFSLWYNIKILHESFDKDKLIALHGNHASTPVRKSSRLGDSRRVF